MIGIVKNVPGVLFDKDGYTIVKKSVPKGGTIPKHNHPNAEIVFTVVFGEIKMTVNSTEDHLLKAGDVLNFDGANSIEGTASEDTQVVISIIKN